MKPVRFPQKKLSLLCSKRQGHALLRYHSTCRDGSRPLGRVLRVSPAPTRGAITRARRSSLHNTFAFSRQLRDDLPLAGCAAFHHPAALLGTLRDVLLPINARVQIYFPLYSVCGASQCVFKVFTNWEKSFGGGVEKVVKDYAEQTVAPYEVGSPPAPHFKNRLAAARAWGR